MSITGTNFSAEASSNVVAFNYPHARALVQAATSSSLSVVVPPAATSGQLRVSTSYGTAISTADAFVPPGGYTTTDVGVTGRLTPTQPLVVTLGANKIAVLVFEGTAGQRVTFNLSAVTISTSTAWIRGPDGSLTLGNTTVTTAGAFIETPLIGISGTYSLFIDPTGAATGSVTVTSNVVSDAPSTITASGLSTVVTLPTAGMNAAVSFVGAAGQRVSLRISASTDCSELYLDPQARRLTSRQSGMDDGVCKLH